MLERDLFIAALDIEDATGRRAYLDSVCTNNAALRNRLERLLSRAREDSDFLDQPAADLCSDWDSAWLAESNGVSQTEDEPVTQTGAAGDTGQTVLLNPAVPSASASSTEVLSASQLGTLFGRYRLVRVLGTGGMGIVYLAEDMRLGRRVALKIPKFDEDGKLHLIERFQREARTMASVLHRHLCPIFDVAEQDGQHYLTMAFIDGETLGQALKRGAKFTTRQIADLVRKLALALEAAHRAGVVHRDLKPANVMIDREGEPIVMDFGLAWMVHETDARVTQSGAIIGTPAYMSPEQAEGEPEKIGAASDIYSLGAILYELLAGRPIHTGSVTNVLYKLKHDAPTRPSVIRHDIDPQLEAICWKAISRRPEERFATAGEFAKALAGVLTEHRESEAPTEPRVIPSRSLIPALSPTAESAPKSIPMVGERKQNSEPPRRRWRTALAGFAAFFLLAAVLVITTRNGTVEVTSPDGKLPKDVQVVVTRGGEEIELLQADNHWSAKLVNGEYQVQLRSGEDRFEITNSQLTINRLGRAVVKLEIRPPVAVVKPQPNPVVAAPAIPVNPPPLSTEPTKPAVPVVVGKPFVVVRAGQDLRTFKTLSGAIDELQSGDVIEIRSNERLPIQLAEPVVKPLVIRAGAGFRPLLAFVGHGTCDIKADFSVEGCDLDLRSAPFAFVDQKNSTWRFHRCRLWGDPHGYVSKLRISESLIISIYGNPAPIDGTETDYEFDNCLIRNNFSLMRYQGGGSHTLRLRNCTFYAVAGLHTRLAHLEKGAALTVEATGNVFHCQSQSNELIDPQSLPHVTWIGTDNCFSGTWYQIWEGNVLKEKGLPAWNKLWKEPEQNSREVDLLAFEWGRIQRLPNPERSLAVQAATEKMISEHKLPEVGPDWTLVGPGDAYVRALAAEGRAVPESELRPERREDGAIVLLRAGKEVRGYVTLLEALDAAQDKDVVEIRTDGLVKDSSWTGDSRLLTIRAGAGYTPTIDGGLASAGTDRLILEGLTIRHVLQASGGVASDFFGDQPLFPTQGSLVRMMNCTLLGERGVSGVDAWMFGDGESVPEIVNCDISFLRIGLRSGGRARLRNSVLNECRPNVESRPAPPSTLEIERCVFWATELAAQIGESIGGASIRSLSAMKTQAHRSIFVSPSDVTFGHPLPIDWTGSGNAFVKPYAFRHGINPLQLEQFQTEFHTEADSIELPPWEFDPAQWRILRDKSPGYQPRPDGSDYGADIDQLVLGLDRNTAHAPVAAPPLAIAPFDAKQAKAHQAAWAEQLGVPVEYKNSIGMQFILIPPGEFTMGSTPAEIAEAVAAFGTAEDQTWPDFFRSEAPQHTVRLTKPFYLGVCEVTQGEYEQVLGKDRNASCFAPQGFGKDQVVGMDTSRHPVEMVNWNDAAEFSATLSEKESLKPFYRREGEVVTQLEGTGYRLPTEAQWEFACRAGTTTKYWSGTTDQDLNRTGWFNFNSDSRTHAVGELAPNPFGLYDMHGNVEEWCQDHFAAYSETLLENPSVTSTTETRRVTRGGYWTFMWPLCRSSHRFARTPESWFNYTGFRVVLEVEAVKAAMKARTP